MDFTYTEEQEMVRELAATFAKNYVAPLSEQMDIDNTMPHHIAEKMAELGFMGINVPEEYGGAGMDEVSKALVIMEIAKVDASVAELLAVHTLTNDIFLKRGTEEEISCFRRIRKSWCICVNRTGSRLRCQCCKDKSNLRWR